jgi:ADP-ribose pyrophosphatase
MEKDIEQNPWTTLTTKPIYDNPWISLAEHEVLNPAGGEGIYGVVTFKNIAVGVVALDENYNTWLVGQYRYTLKEYSWEIPEGGCAKGKESPLESAQRELQEETGLLAQKWTHLLKMHTSNSVTDEVGYVFIAQNLSQGVSSPEDTEQLQVRKISLDQAVKMCMNDEITDAISVMSLYKVKLMKDQGLI